MAKILVVDDEPTVAIAFGQMLREQGYAVLTAARGDEALVQLGKDTPDIVVSDLCMPGLDGLEMFRLIRAQYPRMPVIFMTGQGSMDTAIEATKLGAFDYQLKPLDPEQMLRTIERALESVRLMRRDVELNPSAVAASRDAIVGLSPPMQEVFKAIGRVAPTDATVLIRGESGVGKELVARAIYQHSRRAAAPLLAVNCVAIPEALLESELFGHERGAFTGATARRIGKFEQAHDGTMFLDEIGDIPLGVQAKILRVLQERCFQRIGGSETIHVDVRVLAATNRNLEQAIAEGTFRQDLYYRLNVVTIHIPPLRERREDLAGLVTYFLERFGLELNMPHPVLSDDAQEAILDYAWPGNVRELEHCIYRAMIFTHGYPIQREDILRARDTIAAQTAPVPSESITATVTRLVHDFLDSHGRAGTYDGLLCEVERQLIGETLRRTRGNQTQAARVLGLPRPTLHAKIRKLGLAAETSGEPSDS